MSTVHRDSEELDSRTVWLGTHRLRGLQLCMSGVTVGFVGLYMASHPTPLLVGSVLLLGLATVVSLMRIRLRVRVRCLDVCLWTPVATFSQQRFALDEIEQIHVHHAWYGADLHIIRPQQVPVVLSSLWTPPQLWELAHDLRGLRQRLLDTAAPASGEQRRALTALSQRSQRATEERHSLVQGRGCVSVR